MHMIWACVTIVPFMWLYLTVTVCVAGIYIEVLGHSYRMCGCLGNLVMCLPPQRWRQAAPRGELAVCLGGSQEQVLKYIRVDIE